MWMIVLVALLTLFSVLICLYCYGSLSAMRAKLDASTEVMQAQNTLLCTMSDNQFDMSKKITLHSDNFKVANENFSALNTALSIVQREVSSLKREGVGTDDKTDMN